jgi:hypothetical protein
MEGRGDIVFLIGGGKREVLEGKIINGASLQV